MKKKFFVGTALLVFAPFVFVIGGQFYSIGLLAVARAFNGSGIGSELLLMLTQATAWLYALAAAISCAISGLWLTGLTDGEKPKAGNTQ